MSISKINFTSSLLGNVQNTPAQNPKPEEQTIVDTEEQEISQEQETEVVDNLITEEEPNHTVRNWSIGLSAAAILIGLGVAGRKGHLGEGFQKLLGGKASGAADHAAVSTAEHATGGATAGGSKAGEEAAGHAGIKVDEISLEEFEQIQNKEADFVYGGKKVTSGTEEPKVETPKEEPKPQIEQPKVEEPKVETPKEDPKPKTEQPKVEQPKVKTPKEEPTQTVSESNIEPPKEEPTPTVSESVAETPKPEPKPAAAPKAPTITKAEAQAIDAALDRTLPKIEKEMLTIKTPTVQEIEKMGFDLSKFDMTAEPSSEIVKIIGDKKYFARYYTNGELDNIYMGSKDLEYYYQCDAKVGVESGKLHSYTDYLTDKTYFYNSNGDFDWAMVDIDNLRYFYDKKGLLKRITVVKDFETIKDIAYVHGTDKPVAVYYGGNSFETGKLSKIEVFDGKPTPVKEIYIKNREKITEVV